MFNQLSYTSLIEEEDIVEAMTSKIILMMPKNQELSKFQRFKNQVSRTSGIRAGFLRKVSQLQDSWPPQILCFLRETPSIGHLSLMVRVTTTGKPECKSLLKP